MADITLTKILTESNVPYSDLYDIYEEMGSGEAMARFNAYRESCSATERLLLDRCIDDINANEAFINAHF